MFFFFGYQPAESLDTPLMIGHCMHGRPCHCSAVTMRSTHVIVTACTNAARWRRGLASAIPVARVPVDQAHEQRIKRSLMRAWGADRVPYGNRLECGARLPHATVVRVARSHGEQSAVTVCRSPTLGVGRGGSLNVCGPPPIASAATFPPPPPPFDFISFYLSWISCPSCPSCRT